MPPERTNINPNNIIVNGSTSSSVFGGGNNNNISEGASPPDGHGQESPNHPQQQGQQHPRMIGPQPPPPPQQQQQQQQSQKQQKQQERDKDKSERDQEEEGSDQNREGTTPRTTTNITMASQPPQHILQLWSEVAENLTKHQTVVWTKAVDSLESGRQHLRDHPAPPLPITAPSYATPLSSFSSSVDLRLPASSSPNDEKFDPTTTTDAETIAVTGASPAWNPGREFVDRYMIQVISILLEQQPMKIGQSEKDCVEKSVRCAMQIVKEDLEYMNDVDSAMRALMTEDGGATGDEGGRRTTTMATTTRRHHLRVLAAERNAGVMGPRPCPTLDALGHVFSKKKVYYKTQRQWSNAPVGLPEFRNHMISVFRRTRGFVALAKYLESRAGDPIAFPNLELCREILGGVYDGLPGHVGGSNIGDDKNVVGNGGGSNNNNNNNNNNILASSSLGGGVRGPTAEPSPADIQALSKQKSILSTSRAIASAIMKHILLLDEITLKKIDTKTIEGLRTQLHRLYREMSDADIVGPTGLSPPTVIPDETIGSPRALHEFFVFWRELSLRLITSQSLPLKLFGWDEIASLITESEKMAPPPRRFRVSGAGTSFINGIYEFDPKRVGPNGYVKSGVELQYHRRIPLDGGRIADDLNDHAGSADKVVGCGGNSVPQKQPTMPAVVPADIAGAGKTITLFRCTMRSSHKWWFLSEADEDQPGTDKDVDYYQHKSKRDEEALPSHSGWLTCRAGSDPPPTLEALGKMLPKGEEYNTLEHQLAKWAIENGVIELVLGDGIHREVVSRSAGLIKFLAGMSSDDGDNDVNDPATMSDGERGMKKYCLKASHLLLAWKTCTNKADAAVSAQIYQLLVSILPSLPSSLAIPLIEAIRFSLGQRGSVTPSGGIEKPSDHFFEVSEFCCAIAEKILADSARDGGNNAIATNNAMNKQDLSRKSNAVDPVREAILNLQWAVLSHKDALTLKSYESIKKFVSSEICKRDATSDKLRAIFLMHTRDEISKNVMCSDPNNQGVDETHALHMVQLAKFLLEGCDREEMVLMVSGHNLPMLLFRDLISYMKRRSSSTVTPMRKSSSMFNSSDQFNHAKLLSTRLQTLRFVYGLNINLDPLALDGPKIELSFEQLMRLWNVCSDPNDREALMMFLANASKPDDGSYNQQNDGNCGSLRPENSMHNIKSLSPCFSDNLYIFEHLFCADVGGPAWEDLNELAYQSFQSFDAKEARVSSLTTDALWRICLNSGNDVVASWAMNDLLAVYKNNSYGLSVAASVVEGDRNANETKEDDQFSQRIFSCLVQVKEGLVAGNRSSERSAERCIRILSAAIDQCNSLGGSARALVARLGTMIQMQHQGLASASTPSVDEYLNLVPHGMRGVYSCDTVSIIARATSRGVGTSLGSPSNDITVGDEGPTRYTSMQSERFLLEIHPLQTLASIKSQIASHCKHDEKRVKLNNLTGHRRSVNISNSEPRISVLPDTTLAADLGIMEGSEIIALLSDKVVASNNTIGNNGNANNTTVKFDLHDDPIREKRHQYPMSTSHPNSLDLNGLFSRNGPDGSSNLFFDTLISVLETLPVRAAHDGSSQVGNHKKSVDTHSLAWDLLLAMPTNPGIIAKVQRACSITGVAKVDPSGNEMVVEPIDDIPSWSSLLDFQHFELSVYVMQIVDSFLRPAPVMFSSLPGDLAAEISQSMFDRAKVFRTCFIESGGFDAVLQLFIMSGMGGDKNMGKRNKMGNEFALRIIQECFFRNNELSKEGRDVIVSFDEKTMSNFLNSLVSITIDDCGVSDNAILRVLKLARLMLESGGPSVTTSFTSLPGNAAETFLTSVLLWKGSGSLASASIRSAVNIRKCTEEMILAIPLLSASALPWLVKSLKRIDPSTDGSDEFFSVLLKLVSSVNQIENAAQLRELGTAVCIKLASCPRPNNETANIDHTTGVLCGCLKLLIALIEVDDGDNGGVLVEGSRHVIQSFNIRPWSDEYCAKNSWQREPESLSDNDKALVDLMGSIFDGFISSARSSGLPPICCDKVSRQLAFNVISAAAQACGGGTGYCILTHKINSIIANVAPALRHRWGQNASVDDTSSTSRNTNSVRYSGLKNQGCTCYMNSVLQQLFMMPALRKNLCSAEVPTIVRSSGGGAIVKGDALVGKKISVHWENGNKYDAVVASYEKATGMHTINYSPIHLASGLDNHQQRQQLVFDISTLPRDLPEEFILTEGRPGKETGAFEIIPTIIRTTLVNDGPLQESGATSKSQEALSQIQETPDEASSRKLLEEVQRTFVNLDEARGRCYDPRALVEASHCLKLEFDVWQQNDASEFAMKMLDRLEISLKKWSPSHFKFLAHTFGMKKTTQKICRECGLKTNREEDMMNIDCQIRNKTSIHEALSDMCEDEIMEGDNKVLCDSCKVKTNTVLRTAISVLPDVLVLSLKRFDLDYTTFETVKLNSRCEFGEALNMKKYTLQAKEVLEAANKNLENDNKSELGSTMDIEESETKDGNDEEDPLSVLPDEDYEYRLAGVLVHAGVAQGGHYYSFIKDRTTAKWYRFDDEDVTPFDSSSIEHECFGGKVKKETKFPNGHTHTVESEQFANALMLFYEKVKPVQFAAVAPMEEEPNAALSNLEYTNGYDIFLPEVRKSNSTHSWQSFLLTDEFQKFVKEFLDLCAGRKQLKEEEDSMDITPTSSPSPVLLWTEMESWRLDGIRMSLSFVFDVLFHLSLKKAALDDWSKILQEVFSSAYDIAAMFVSDLAKRTHQVYENWLRAFVMECPEEGSRRTALQIFSSAISSLLSNPTEQSLLQIWTQAWATQVLELETVLATKRQHGVVMPTRLEAVEMRPREDPSKIGVTATSIGIILSYLAQLIEVSPRYTQGNIELCFFIRELASGQTPTARILRDAMVEAQFIARLSCLAIREKTHEVLRAIFPGSSLPLDVVDAISREETLSSNIMHVGMNNAGIHGVGGNQLLLEAIGCLLGTPWIKQEAISFETGEVNRGRTIRALTPRAIEALTAVFEESKPRSSTGMILRDIRHYLQKCGQHVPPQRIDQIFSRHAVDEPDGSKLLTLKGFLAYYRDAVHTNEYQVQKELHAFGFRPDLTRRHDDCKWYFDESSGQKRPCSIRECIVNDLVMNSSCLSKIHNFTELGLQTLYFLNFAQTQSNNGVVEYILAASAIFRDSKRLIFDSLGYLYEHLGSWNGGSAAEGYPLIIMILNVLTAIRDEKQQSRIATVMINDDGEERREGLMTKGERILQEYPTDYRARAYADKYAEIIIMLQKQHAISNWMSLHRSRWTWIEPDAHPETTHPLQSRSDNSVRRGGGHQNVSTHHQNNDPNANDESDLDEDSRSDEDEDTIREMVVEGCGVPEINGIFTRAGSYDGVSKYTKHTKYQGKEEEFSLFRCKLTDNTRRWYISIVPMNAHPGTTKDIDFYAAVPSPHGEDGSLPPRANWMCIPNSGGIIPAPVVYPRSFVVPRNIYDEGDENQLPGNIIVDQDETGYL